jgi:cell division protein FtsB
MSGQGKRPVARSNQRGMVLIMLVVMILLVVMVYQSRRLTLKNAALADQISQLSELIVEEEGRSEQIEDFRAYTRSDEYVEKTAREKFGFVYPDEVIFRSAGS